MPVVDKGHGWREVCVRDPDGYEWAVGVLIDPAKGPFGPHINGGCTPFDHHPRRRVSSRVIISGFIFFFDGSSTPSDK